MTVYERNPRGRTHGFAVTFGEDLLDEAHRCDPVSARWLRSSARLWNAQSVLVGDARPVHLGGKYGYSIARVTMVDLLIRRAEQLGVDLRFDTPAPPRAEIDADVVVATDGAGSRLREARREHFGTTIETGESPYLWLGTERDSATFLFAYERTDAGWISIHVYPSSNGLSTCIVDCEQPTWLGLGFDTMAGPEALKTLQEIFDRALDGHRMLPPPTGLPDAPWLRFREVRNLTWRDGNLVLAGDAAHTTHFGIGSGTQLAIEDAIGLADALYGATGAPRDVVDLGCADGRGAALAAYDARRRAVLGPIQDMARRNMHWFEQANRRLERGEDPVEFAWALLGRRGDMGRLHYQLHRATQFGPLRQVRRGMTTARRVRRAARRGDLGRPGGPTG
ncbi:FAD-dependent monooxygenase [Pseudonocardia sp. HH130630-07]|uniref:FAD-dependent monooxygenase n=1 Tax=Pseudonocardia sp. HH130630-07 TaxID=1690815 RepID=UPI000814E1F5|nr:FAD-dependent monooxygenase [Pseudonocardia sp. HH130630-07]ANY08713.1 hypothetical protein AFB00_23340 [Pseudonocardia sp. HH130630-07]